jgi:hypothetical protein
MWAFIVTAPGCNTGRWLDEASAPGSCGTGRGPEGFFGLLGNVETVEDKL